MQADDIDNRFAYHAPRDEHTNEAHEFFRSECGRLAHAINDHPLVPEGREKSLAVTHLEEAMMWVNAAIARRP